MLPGSFDTIFSQFLNWSRQSIKICTGSPKKKAHCIESIPYFYLIFFYFRYWIRHSGLTQPKSQAVGLGLIRWRGCKGHNLFQFHHWPRELKQLNILNQQPLSQRPSWWCRNWLGVAFCRGRQKRQNQNDSIRKGKKDHKFCQNFQ